MAGAGLSFVLAAVFLQSTSWTPVQDVPSAPQQLIHYPEFASDVKLPMSEFYTPPDPLPDVIPGTLLKHEPIEGVPAGYRATRLMYVSSREDGTPVAITAAFFERTDTPPPDGRPLIGFSHGTTGLARFCGISQAPFVPGTTGAQFWRPEIKPLLDAGYAVVGTDYQNMGAPGTPSYLVAKSEAHAVLDSMRAAVQLAPVNSTKMALIGHSQGGQAALASAQLHDAYAPELAIRGVVSEAPGMLVGLPIVIKQLVSSNSGNTASRSEYLSLVIESWSKTYPGQIQAGQVMTPEGVKMLPLTEELCGPPLAKEFDQPLSTYYKSEFPTSFLRIANENVPDEPVPVPMLMTQGMEDISIVPQFSIATFRAICRTGAHAQLRMYPGDDHNSLLWSSMPHTIDWLNDRMAGVPADNECEGRQ